MTITTNTELRNGDLTHTVLEVLTPEQAAPFARLVDTDADTAIARGETFARVHTAFGGREFWQIAWVSASGTVAALRETRSRTEASTEALAAKIA